MRRGRDRCPGPPPVEDPWLKYANATPQELTEYMRESAESCRRNGCDGRCKCDDKENQ